MNKMMTSVLALGAGIAAYNIAQRSDFMSSRQMKRLTKTIKRTFS